MATLSDTDAKDLVRKGYDSIAPAYLEFIGALPSPNIAWTDKLLTALTSPGTSEVLELGCGNGVPCTIHVASLVGRLTANDISQTQIALARDNLHSDNNVSFIAGDMTQLAFPPASYDAVLALYSLVHLPLEEQPVMLSKIWTWLKPGGLVLCNFDVEEDPGSVMDDWLGCPMFKAGYGVAGSRGIVQVAGFDILEAEEISSVDGKNTVPFLWVLARKRSVPDQTADK